MLFFDSIKCTLALVGTLLGIAVNAKPVTTGEQTAEGFVGWTGVSEKNHFAGRQLCSSDLRHKVTIAVVLESDVKLRDQLALVAKIMPRVKYDISATGIDDWQVPRDFVGIVSCRGAVTRDVLGVALKPATGENAAITESIRNVIGNGSGAFSAAAFVGAADPTGKCPYVYVLGPSGNKPIWEGTVTAKSAPEAKAAIEKAKKELDAWETKWRPFFGNVAEPKYFPQLVKALEKGKTAKSCPLAPIEKAIHAEVISKDAAKAKEAQVLYDALCQTRSDLEFRIKLEAGNYPHVAMVDLAELFKYWPGERKRMESVMARLKANPDAEMFSKIYVKLREWSHPDFQCKSAGEAKKIVVELKKMKKQSAKCKESKNIPIQNAAARMEAQIDTLIETISVSVGK